MTTFRDMALIQELYQLNYEVTTCVKQMRQIELSRWSGNRSNNKPLEIEGEIAALALRIRRATHKIDIVVGKLLGDGQ